MQLAKKLILVVLILELVTGCKWFTEGMGTPFLSMTNIKVPAGTPVFRQGFKDGCSTALYSRGNGLYRTRYQYRYDPKLIEHPEYRFGHSRGYSYCFTYAASPLNGPNGSSDKYLNPYPNQEPQFQGANYNNVGLFDGLSPIIGVSSAGDGLDGLFQMWSQGQSTASGSGSALGAYPTWGGGNRGQFFGQQ